MRSSTENGHHDGRELGVAIIGLGGAVATTTVAGTLLIRKGFQSTAGLPLAEYSDFDLIDYDRIVYAGWDLYQDNLYAAAIKHRVLDETQLGKIKSELTEITPWPAIANKAFCSGVVSEQDTTGTLLEQLDSIRFQLRAFIEQIRGEVVVINCASTEHAVDPNLPEYQTLEAFERAVRADSPHISPAMLYAYGCLEVGVPYANFTPSLAVDIPALLELARRRGVPVAGKDGKTGQTYLKTVLAPAFRDRALHVDGWYSTNILGNRDGEALEEPKSRQSKINTKGSVLDACLGYHVENHQIHIHYYKPRGDDKEAWDNIDISGFLGHPMQIKVNFLCKDSILAAPLVIEIARCLELAKRTARGGVVEALSVFFKGPTTQEGTEPEHRFHVQQATLLRWLEEQSRIARHGSPAAGANEVSAQ